MSEYEAFDFEVMENDITLSWLGLDGPDVEQSKADLFLHIRKLAYAILLTSNYASYNMDYEDVSYEYGVYLYERLATKSFIPKYEDRFPWNNYIRMNIRHIIFSRFINSDPTLYNDICDILENNHEDYEELKVDDKTTDRMSHTHSINKILGWLRVFYPEHEIRRLFPISRAMLLSYGNNFMSSDAPQDVIDFIRVFVSVSKRIIYAGVNTDYKQYKRSELRGLTDSALKSTLFLATVVNSSFFPVILLLGCDLDSLLRLITIGGGSTIRIPTMKEFESVLGCTLTASNMIINNNSDIETVKWKEKNAHNLVFSQSININNLVGKVLDCGKLADGEGTGENSPLIYLLLSAIKSLDVVTRTLETKANEVEFSELVEQYDVIAKMTMNLITAMSPNQ